MTINVVSLKMEPQHYTYSIYIDMKCFPQLQETEKGPHPLVFDELKRESVFYRQAQEAVISVLPKLKKLGLRTERPNDYLAEMAKSDTHMQKVWF